MWYAVCDIKTDIMEEAMSWLIGHILFLISWRFNRPDYFVPMTDDGLITY